MTEKAFVSVNGYDWLITYTPERMPIHVRNAFDENEEVVRGMIAQILLMNDANPKNIEALNKGNQFVNIQLAGVTNV
jgi:hypothetical protein